jgi:hypothetical protein
VRQRSMHGSAEERQPDHPIPRYSLSSPHLHSGCPWPTRGSKMTSWCVSASAEERELDRPIPRYSLSSPHLHSVAPRGVQNDIVMCENEGPAMIVAYPYCHRGAVGSIHTPSCEPHMGALVLCGRGTVNPCRQPKRVDYMQS